MTIGNTEASTCRHKATAATLQSQLVEVQQQYMAYGDRYYRERQYRYNMALVAARALVGFHAAAHAGEINECTDCSPDWAPVRSAWGANAPGE